MVTIYALKDPDTDDIRYIGQSKNVHSRYGTHINAARKGAPAGANGAYREWMEDLKGRNKEPVLEVIEEVSDEEGNRTEAEQIAKHRKTSLLVNATFGATRQPSSKLPDDWLRKMEWSNDFWKMVDDIACKYGANFIEGMTTELVLGNRNYNQLSDDERLRLDMIEVWHRYVIRQPGYMMSYLLHQSGGVQPRMPREELSKVIPLLFQHFCEKTRQVMTDAEGND